MDHTADLGLEIRAPTLPDVFRRAAAGMMYLLLERVPDDEPEERTVGAEGPDPAGLLRAWLREVLHLFDSEGFAVAAVDVLELGGEDGTSFLETALRGSTDPGRPVREIKGVTLHGLTLERRDEGWFGRVIFDV